MDLEVPISEGMVMNAMIAIPQGAEWLVILAIVILVFGASRLPDLARGTGQALRIFKAETKGLKDDDADDDTTPTPTAGTRAQSKLESRPSATADRWPDFEADVQHVRRDGSI